MNAITDQPVAEASPAQSRAAPPLRQRLTRKLRPAIGAVALVAGVVTTSWWFTEGRWIASTDDAYVQGDIAVLSPRVDGNVESISVADNQFVRAGQPLIALDPSDYDARLAQARANAADAEAAVVTAGRQLVQQQATIEAAIATVARAEASRIQTTADAARSATLVTAGWTSRQANDKALADARAADAAVAAAAAQQKAAQDQIAVLAAQVNSAEAKQKSAEAALRLAENNLSYTVIRAPFDGIVGNRAAEIGQHVAAGTQLIAIAPPADKLYVVANFKETDLRRMRPGMNVRVVPDIDPSAAVDGRVDSLAPATGAVFSLLPPENATGNFTKVVQRVPVKIALDPAEAAHAAWLRAGLSVTAEVDTRGPHAERLGLFGAAAAGLRSVVP